MPSADVTSAGVGLVRRSAAVGLRKQSKLVGHSKEKSTQQEARLVGTDKSMQDR